MPFIEERAKEKNDQTKEKNLKGKEREMQRTKRKKNAMLKAIKE